MACPVRQKSSPSNGAATPRPTKPTCGASASAFGWGAPGAACRARSCPRRPASRSAIWPSWSAAPATPRCSSCARSRMPWGWRWPQLIGDQPERPIDLTLAMHQLERLSPAELAEARRLLAQRFGKPSAVGAGPHRAGGPARCRQDHARPARGAGAGRAVRGTRPRDRARERHGAVGDFCHAWPGHVPPAGAPVPGDDHRALRPRGDCHRRQPGDRSRRPTISCCRPASSSGSAPSPTST